MEGLISKIMDISPSGFEKLCQLVLRRNGFLKVEVSGRSHDGGIDGIGILKISLVTFTVLFQCKRDIEVRLVQIRLETSEELCQVGLIRNSYLQRVHLLVKQLRKHPVTGAETIELRWKRFLLLVKDLGMGVKTKELVVIDEDFFGEYK